MSADPQIAKMEANILEKTGKPVSEWVKMVKASGLEKHGQIVKFLKSDHEFTHGYANLVAHQALKSSAEHHDDDDLVAAQYAGPKADLKPIYEKVIATVQGFGSDVEAAPKKAYVSLRPKRAWTWASISRARLPQDGWRPQEASMPWSRTGCAWNPRTSSTHKLNHG